MKPVAIPVKVAAVPTELTREDRWVLWRYVEQHGRWTKIPCQSNGRYAKPNDASTWASFDEIDGAYRRGAVDGIGFCLGDGWAGIDLDKCIVNESLVAGAQPFFAKLSSVYYELSPSGRGYKAFGRSPRMGGEINFETEQRVPFTASRFFAVTGCAPISVDVEKPSVQTDLTALLDLWFPQAIKPVDPFGPTPAFIRPGDVRGTENIDNRPLYPKLNDRDVVAAIMASPQATKFRALADGDMSEYGGDHSRADQALINILAYWCQGDRDQIVRLFKKSGLYRTKFDTRSYREATLLKAGVR